MKREHGGLLVLGGLVLAFGGADPGLVLAAETQVHQIEFGAKEQQLIQKEQQLIERQTQVREKALEEIKRSHEEDKIQRQELLKKQEDRAKAAETRQAETRALQESRRNPAASSIDEQLNSFVSPAEGGPSGDEATGGVPGSRRLKIKRPPGNPVLGMIPISAIEYEERGGDALRVTRKAAMTQSDSFGNRRVVVTLPPGSRVFKNMEGVEAGNWVVEFYP